MKASKGLSTLMLFLLAACLLVGSADDIGADRERNELSVIPRANMEPIQAGKERLPVTASEQGLACDPVNATYIIEGSETTLKDGYSERAVGRDSATKIRTFALGDVVEGDLDGDGDEDAALLLVHDPGGSGTFYYVAVAENINGGYWGTNGVGLGDRIAFKGLQVRNRLVIARYAERGPSEPMSTAPSAEALSYLAFDEGKLKALEPLGQDEQILQGLVTIGHEVRSFYPCTQKTHYWLSGDSPALGEIMARYERALPDARPYTPLFVVLAGKFFEKPCHGFGADYVGAFLATQLVAVRPEGNCRTKSKQNR
jgi:hypothetical protein